MTAREALDELHRVSAEELVSLNAGLEERADLLKAIIGVKRKHERGRRGAAELRDELNREAAEE